VNVRIIMLVCIPILTAGPATAADEADQPKDLGAPVRAILAAKCGECHGPTLPRPKGGLVLDDPDRLAANPDLVTAAQPAESALWEVIRDGEMPPAQARAGPLSEAEKETIHAWITSLAPSTPPVAPPSAYTPPPASAPEGRPTSVLGWLGRFHVVALHFPIALLAAAALAEVIAAGRGRGSPPPAVRFCVLVGAIGAVATAALGWLHADFGGHGSASAATLSLHRWLGTTTALWAVAIAWASEWDCRLGQRSWLCRFVLWSGALVLAATAHLGGVLVHGPDFLGW
jgi:mono/diheme cytochrome c family protein